MRKRIWITMQMGRTVSGATYLLALVLLTGGWQEMKSQPGIFFVALDGNDAWSGCLPNPNGPATDGPLRTLAKAQKLVRAADIHLQRQVLIRQGTHYLEAPLVFTAKDSGSAACPVTYRAYPGEAVTISGGRSITGWQERPGNLWAAPVPAAKTGLWDFRQLRCGDQLQTLARYPECDPQDPLKTGWLFARQASDTPGSWYTTVACIHTPGDWLEWEVDIAQTETYNLWLYYGQNMKPHGMTEMDGRTVFQVDGGADVPLLNLPDTGDWRRHHWRQCAELELSQGKHVLRWTNRKGGGIDFNAFALCTDSAWQPTGTTPPPPAAGRQMLIIQAEKYARAKCKEMKISASQPRGKADELPFTPDQIPTALDVTGGQIMVFPAWGWVGGVVQIDSISRTKGMLRLTGKNAQQEIRIGNRYYIQNVRGALTSPGEFFLDKKAGELLCIPESANFHEQAVVAPFLDRLVELRGDPEANRFPEHINFVGLSFRDARYSLAVESLYSPDDAAIHIDHARNITVSNCTFSHLGGYAVRLTGATAHCQILACTIKNMGQGGIIAKGRDSIQPTDCTIAGCHISDLGRIYKHVAGIYLTTGSGFRIAHNTIHDVPRYAISFKSYNQDNVSHNNIAEYNDLRRTNLETNDTGAIETLGRDQALSGNIIRYNLILDVIGMKHTPEGKLVTPHYTWGIYLDDYSSGTQVYGNIVARTVRGGYHNHLGFDNVVKNNIFVNGDDYQAEWNGKDDMRRNTFTHNIVVFANPEAVYIHSGGWHPEVLKTCDNNLVWCPAIDLATADKAITPAGTWQQWQALGFDRNSLIADPLFVDAEHDDYRLKPNSPALQLGFKPIPVEKIGLQGYQEFASQTATLKGPADDETHQR